MADRETIQEGERAIRLNSDITGGLGKHKKGTVLRNLSQAAFIGLRADHEVVKPGSTTTVGEEPMAARPPAPPPPSASK